jgi:hypothetical protein
MVPSHTKKFYSFKEHAINNELVQYESFFWSPDYLDQSAWLQHIPFAFWIIEALRPKVLVELGVYTGVSYFSFCQAVERLSLATTCYGVDTWNGDEHSGLYDEQVFTKVTCHNTKTFSRFSKLVRSTFDVANEYFLDSSIDLLHIDGLHTYEAVRHDFETWVPKVSETGLVLFHDINVRERKFGVFRFWAELKQRYPTFQFDFGEGLGVVAPGKVPEKLIRLFSKGGNGPYNTFLTNIFSERGTHIQTAFENDLRIDHERKNLVQQKEANRQLNESNGALQANNDELHTTIQHLQARNQEDKKNLEDIQSSIGELSEQLSASKKERELLYKQLKWYRDTYETRSILGVLKEKITAKRKKSLLK